MNGHEFEPLIELSLQSSGKTKGISVNNRSFKPSLQRVGVVIVVIFAGVAVQKSLKASQQRSEARICHDHLTEMSAALQAYRRDHDGKLPKDLVVPDGLSQVVPEETLYPRYIKSKESFSCPTQLDYFNRHGSNSKPGFVTYQYKVKSWVQDASLYYPSREFYETIVPEKGNEIILVACLSHPAPEKTWAIMWDGSIQEQPYLYDDTFGRGKRDPQRQEMVRKLRKRGARIPGE